MKPITFPKQYKKLPNGYQIVYIENCKHYTWVFGELYGELFHNCFSARQAAFRHYQSQLEKK